nr:MAG TPA: hypothetical protein [Caudoviricetes sp.]
MDGPASIRWAHMVADITCRGAGKGRHPSPSVA